MNSAAADIPRSLAAAGRLGGFMVLTGLMLRMCSSSSTATHSSQATAWLLMLAGSAVHWAATARYRRTGDTVHRRPFIIAVGGLAILYSVGAKDFEATERVVALSAFLCGGAALADRWRCPKARGAALADLITVFVVLVLYGLAQRLWLFDHLRDAAKDLLGDRLTPETRAFLESPRARSTFGQANGFAAFLLLFLPWTLRLAADRTVAGGTRLLPLVSVMAGMLASGSKAGILVGLLVAGVIVGRHGGRRRVLGYGLAGCAAAVAGWAAVAASGALGPEWRERTASLAVRFDYWRTAWGFFADHPLRGVGLERFADHAAFDAPADAAFSRYAHCSVLHLAAETGLMGLSVFAPLAIAALRRPSSAPPALDGADELTPISPPRWWAGPATVMTALFLAVLTTPPDRLDLFFIDIDDGVRFALVTLAVNIAIVVLAHRLFARSLALTLGRRPEMARDGLRWGLIAFMAHSLVDFDFNVDGCVAALTCVVALRVGSPGVSRATSPLWSSSLAIAAVVVASLWTWRVHGVDEALLAGPGGRTSALSVESRRRPPQKAVVVEFVMRSGLAANASPSDRQRALAVLDRHRHTLGDLPIYRRLHDALTSGGR